MFSSIKLYNLWFFYVIAYVVAYSIQLWANHKRGEPFDDPEFLFRGSKIFVIAMVWLISGFVISLFVPVDFGSWFVAGMVFYIAGILIGAAALYSFAQNKGLVTSGIHKYSRNPIYVGWTLVIFGMTLMGWSSSVWSLLFLLYFLITIPYFHWTVSLEEKFLANKYGDSYIAYLRSTPRYLGYAKAEGV